MRAQKAKLIKIVTLVTILVVLAPFLAPNVGSITTAYGTRPDAWFQDGKAAVYINDTIEGAAVHGWPCVYQLSDGTYWVVFMWGGSTVGGNAVPVICYKQSRSSLYYFGYYANWTAEQQDDYLEMELIPGNITIGGGTPSRFVGEAAIKGDKPQICEDRWGKIWLVYQNASKIIAESTVLFYKVTEDRGKTWSEAKPISLGTTGRGGTPVITCTSNNTIVVAWDEGSSTGDNGIMFTYTSDNGTTWATPQYASKTPVSGTHLWPDVEWLEVWNSTTQSFEEVLVFTYVVYTSIGGTDKWAAVCRWTRDLGATWYPDPGTAAGVLIMDTGVTSTSDYPASSIAQVHIREVANNESQNRTIIAFADAGSNTIYAPKFKISPANLTSKADWSADTYGPLGSNAGDKNNRPCHYIGPMIWSENETLNSAYLEAMFVYAQNLDNYKGGWATAGYWKNTSAYGTFGGWVRDGAGAGISNASVSVYKSGSNIPVATSKTNETGFYAVKALDWADTGTSYEVEACESNYAPSGRVTATLYYAQNTWLNFTLGVVGIEFKLSTGWNSICLTLANSTITNASALASAIGANCTYIANWSGSEFIIYDAVAKTNNFNLELGRGYEVYVTAPTIFVLKGDKITSATLTLNPGWNNIGWFNATAKNASALAAEIKYCTAVAEWNATLGRFVMHLKNTDINDFMIVSGKSYLVYVTGSSTWTQYP
ncbi:MAG: hypothetical protein AB1485_04840 [Candidatus Thermoplasmatota archaeon]